ncbi:glycosyltransferase [Brooklawnia cerclae]|uniref:Galactofuranosylgalactofuranosylrhamnosyl-N-acetylglucosaminyl-diphospho-decaprenol beta-1,5/1,6-galactofuranosyltransferase n=1 Tax=Brooklawnia cerclae TaxID=349934 RepID=A0ABX0SNN1_9ACTN|nr:glycosyltransferase [Brooklawnia cerclae]NIH58650.1 galactofuranosylgalactofuranosylrhamnosyl-N-acetylglucosaminyl-diphospho-decaprenol beta-1,5/1,6-galactofuranosyltransferase [Brooklawnia cerclae]
MSESLTETGVRMPTEWGDQAVSQVTSADQYRIAMRVIFPVGGDSDVLPAYVDRSDDENAAWNIHPDDVLGRYSMLVRAGDRVSFGSYWNAFPASYWQRWTDVRTVRLAVNTIGDGSIIVYRSNARGTKQRVDMVRVGADAEQSVFDLPIKEFGDGGFYWFEFVAGSAEMTLESAQWWVPAGESFRGTVTLSTTTYNKPDYVVRNLNLIASQPDVVGILDEMIVVDQGTKKVADESGYAEAATAMGGKVAIIEQPNLGGSGGFARGQYEATVRGRSDYVILLDDDIRIEPETLVRLTTFADMSKKPTIVGAQMFDLMNRSVMYTFGEVVNNYTWAPAIPRFDNEMYHDFAEEGLRSTSWMHGRVDVDYNGWWCCLIPTQVIRKIGLSLPLFIKWDDLEYAVRAGKAGFPTVSLPGCAVWHVTWADKDDLVGWQSYFHNRNRIITALLHSPFEKGGAMLANAEINDMKHISAMQYYTAAGRLLAEQDVLAGPDQLHSILESRNKEVRAMAKEYSDAQFKPEVEDFPPVYLEKPRRPTKQAWMKDGKEVPVPKPRLLVMGMQAVARQLLPLSKNATDNPQTIIPHRDNKWWKVSRWDSALVTNADGNGVSWYRRQPEKVRQMVLESFRNYARIYAKWDELARQYQEALPRLTSFESWERTFGISTEPSSPQQREETAGRE